MPHPFDSRSAQVTEELLSSRRSGRPGSLYHLTQVLSAYNTNRIEGSVLTHEQTRLIYETRTLVVDPGNGPGGTAAVPVDDVVETLNSFELFDTVLDDLHQPLTAEMLKRYHGILKRGTAQSLDPRFAVGAFKALPNAVGLTPTTPPEHVELAIAELLEHAPRDLEAIAAFHHRFESIHPFADGNGRIGRAAMFKQTLEAGVAPFVVLNQAKAFYYRGLSEFSTEPGFLIGTLESMQDSYAEIAAPLLPNSP